MSSGAPASRRGTFPPRAAAPDPADTPAPSAAPPSSSLTNGKDESPASFSLAPEAVVGRKKKAPDIDISALLSLKDGELLTSKKLSQIVVLNATASPHLQRREMGGGMKSPASSPLMRRKNGLPAGRVCPRASSRLLSNRGDDEVAHRSILTISEDAAISYVDEDEEAIDALLQAKAGGTMDGQSLRFRDPEHVRSVIDALKTRDLSDDDVSPRLRALSAGLLDDELEGMVFDDGEISVRGASTSGMLRRAREFFDDGFSSADITVVHAVLKSIPDRSRSVSDNTSVQSSPSNHSGLSSSTSGSSGPDSATELAPGPAAANPFGDMADLFAVCNALSALMVSEEDEKGAVAGMIPMEDTHVPSDKERRRRSFERFYHDERGNEPLAAGHFDIEVIREELFSEAPDGVDPAPNEAGTKATLPDQDQTALKKLAAEQSESASEDGYRPRTTSRAKEPQLTVPMVDDSYRPRTSSKVIEPQLTVPVADDSYRPRTSSKVIATELPGEAVA